VAIVAAAAFLGAVIAAGSTGQVGAPAGTVEAGDGVFIRVGDLVTVRGRLAQRDYDDGANVVWFTDEAFLHGQISDALQPPFSYCELDEQLPFDSCLSIVIT
jgi:hypothetical protein